MIIAVGCDHAAYDYKQKLVAHLQALGHTVEDVGCHSTESVDYADYAKPVAQMVAAGKAQRGILLCHTGIGMSIAANKVNGIRCALCADGFAARLTREHNDSNILAIGAGMIGYPLAQEIAEIWLATEFVGGRHLRRVNKIMDLEAR
ncbi:ribose 5-phosphate isomerase B [Christensenellaceae bacterium OttesenSCG-928-L17]|nr:ribose 5-phosphate isomerase B [Christensenellaceae bacterium OttesenSCG-928-L17]